MVAVAASVTTVESADSVTTIPPAGAGPVRVMVAVDPDPPTTLDGVIATAATDGGTTVRTKLAVEEPRLAITVTGDAAVTGLVAIEKETEVLPSGMITVAGGEATPLDEESATVTPPAGAGPLRVTVPEAALPPVTDVLSTLRAATAKSTPVVVRIPRPS